jgi:hypothetical protein
MNVCLTDGGDGYDHLVGGASLIMSLIVMIDIWLNGADQ